MFHHGAPARMAAIVDWEMATIGDPLLDLAWVVMAWPNPGEERAKSGYVDYTGMPSREELMQRYAQVSGLPIDEMDYHVILARFKMAIVLEGGYARFVHGGADNPKMEMSHLARRLRPRAPLDASLEPTGGASPGPLRRLGTAGNIAAELRRQLGQGSGLNDADVRAVIDLLIQKGLVAAATGPSGTGPDPHPDADRSLELRPWRL
jgi:hypothetical protein